MKNKLLTIIIPTYKRNEYIVRAIESILKEEGNYEIIVVDDNGEDTLYCKKNQILLEKYINENKITYIKHTKNMNGACARNSGIKIAHGEYITFLDDDDEFINNRYSEFEKIVKEKKYDFICTGGIKVFQNGIIQKFIPDIEKDNKELIKELLMQKSFIGTGSNMICKKSIINEINGFDESFRRHQDIEFMIRYFEKCDSKYCISKILIQKNAEDSLNVPNIDNMLDIKRHFLEKFQYIIKEFDLDVQKNIYMENYNEILKYCYINKDKANKIKLVKIMKENKIYDREYVIKLKIRFFLRKIFILKAIVMFVRKIKKGMMKEKNVKVK